MSDEDAAKLLDAKNPGEFRMIYEKRHEEMIRQAERVGEARGEAKLREVAKRMLASGMPISQVAEYTSLSEEELETLRESIAN